MALSFDTQGATMQDDFGHDALMGLQELDSHLAMFGADSSKSPASAAADHQSDNFFDTIESSSGLDNHDFAYIELDTSVPGVSVDPVSRDNKDSSSQLTNPRPFINDIVNIKNEHASTSNSSSMATYSSDVSSNLSSISSAGTSPVAFDSHTRHTGSTSNLNADSSSTRPVHNVRPKASIPTDLSPEEYANQCIAAAESSRLLPYSLHSEEHSLLRAHLSRSQVTTYLNIRNAILRLWVRNPTISVLRDEAIGCCKDSRWFDVASLSYDWLVRRGYINFGCTEYVESRYPPQKRNKVKRKRKTIAVIGAGMSGLGCARQLEGLFAQFEHHFREKGEDVPEVIVLEGRDRVGGRVCSRSLKSTANPSKLPLGHRCTAEMGGMIITGFDRGNPLNVLVRGQLALPYHALRPAMTLYDLNGQPVDLKRDQLAEKLYNDVLERVSDYKFKSVQYEILEGDRDLINAGKDGHGDNSKTMQVLEDKSTLRATASVNSVLSQAETLPPIKATEVIPVSSDRLTGRAHLEPGIPAAHTAAFRARQIGWQLNDGIKDDYDLDLTEPATAGNATLGSVMDAALMQFQKVTQLLPLDLRLINWHIANLEYSNAINYNELSLGGWDVDAGNEWEGKHTMVVGGYQQVPRGLMQCPTPLNVKRRAVVKRICYSPDGIAPARIDLDNGSSVEADIVVSSIPLGVLKQDTVIFEPSLPDWKTGAIKRIGFGVLNKVVLVYKHAFWDTKRDIFGVLRQPTHQASLEQRDYSANRGRFFQWFNVTKTSGLPTLLVLMAGDAAFHVEASSDGNLIREATTVLRGVFGPNVPDPLETLVTRWGQDRFARGSYSYTGPNFRTDDYETMARPVGNLFFTGEHTCGTHPATVHGAYISGLRVASEVLEAIIGPISHPEPLLPPRENANSLKRKASTGPDTPTDPKSARLLAYEYEVWDAIYKKLGDRAWKPKKESANAYILYSKDNYEIAKQSCDSNRRPGKGKAISNEVRVMLAKMWKEAPEDIKEPYISTANVQKERYREKMAEYNEQSKKWDRDALEFRKVYELEHPSIPGKDEPLDDEWTRNRKAKKTTVKEKSFYAEAVNSDAEI